MKDDKKVEDVEKVGISMSKKIYKWYVAIAERERVEVEKLIEDLLNTLYQFRGELRDVKRSYSPISPINGSTELGHVLSYILSLGSMIFHISEHILLKLGGRGSFVLSDTKLVEDKPGAYKGVFFEFIAREVDDNMVIDYLTLQIQHDGLYLDATLVMRFRSPIEALEALERLREAALKVIDKDHVKMATNALSNSGGQFNIDITPYNETIYLTFMMYANDLESMLKINQVNAILREICQEAGIQVEVDVREER